MQYRATIFETQDDHKVICDIWESAPDAMTYNQFMDFVRRRGECEIKAGKEIRIEEVK